MTAKKLRRLRKSSGWQKILRSWFYFRIGHGTYWHYFLAFAQWIVVIYTLYVVTSPIAGVFGTIQIFSVCFVPLYISLCLLAGYIHYRISQAYQTEIEVAFEENPFAYKVLRKGKEQKLLEYWLFQSQMFLKMAKELKVLKSEEEEQQWLGYIAMLQHLIEGKDIRTFQ